MLTLAAMLVVFVLVEKITLGREESLTADQALSPRDKVAIHKVPQ